MAKVGLVTHTGKVSLDMWIVHMDMDMCDHFFYALCQRIGKVRRSCSITEQKSHWMAIG